MKKIAALLFLLFLISSQMESVKSGPEDCLDSCTTGCVQKDTRLTARCDRKCSIKCGPDGAVETGRG